MVLNQCAFRILSPVAFETVKNQKKRNKKERFYEKNFHFQFLKFLKFRIRF